MLDADELMYAEDKIAAQAAEIARLRGTVTETERDLAVAVTRAREIEIERDQARAERDALAAALKGLVESDAYVTHGSPCLCYAHTVARNALASMETGHE